MWYLIARSYFQNHLEKKKKYLVFFVVEVEGEMMERVN